MPQAGGYSSGSGNLTRWILIWTKLGLHRTPRSPCRRSTLGWPHRDCARVAKIVFEGQRLEPLEPNLGIFAFSTQPLPQHVYTLYFSISRILPKSRGHIYRFLQLVLAPCPPDRPDPAPPSLVGHPAGQRVGALPCGETETPSCERTTRDCGADRWKRVYSQSVCFKEGSTSSGSRR